MNRIIISTIITTAICLTPSEATTQDTTWYTGESTYYGGIAGTNSGNCGIYVEEGDIYHCAMNHEQYDSSYACGACVKVIGPQGEITVKVVDRCPECKVGDIDLTTEAFSKIADIKDGRIPIKWHFTPCEDEGNIKVLFSEGTSPYYFKAIFYDIRHRLKTVEYRNSDGTFVPIHREMYNYFVESEGIDNGATQCGPYTFRLTDEYGQSVVVEDIVYQTGIEIDLGKQFPPTDESTTAGIEEKCREEESVQKIVVIDLLGREIFTSRQISDYDKLSRNIKTPHIVKIIYSNHIEIHK